VSSEGDVAATYQQQVFFVAREIDAFGVKDAIGQSRRDQTKFLPYTH
jgi:hypothetical protein